LCLVELACYQRGAAQVDQRHLQTVGVTYLSAETHACRRRGSDRVEIALEETVERSSLEERERGGGVVDALRHDLALIEQPPGGRAITGHVRGDRSDGERFREQTELGCVPSHQHGSCQRWPRGCRIALQHGQEAT
jgi:hypothetical protein